MTDLIVLLRPRRGLSDHKEGRLLAKEALQRFGAPTHVPRGRYGEPVWPKGFTGSISHCRTHCLCAVGKSPPYLSIGCDVEQISRFNQKIAERVLTSRELNRVEGLAHVAIAFCAKEAFYKLQHPLYRRSLSFKEAEVYIDYEERRVLVESFIRVCGFFIVGEDSAAVVLTAP